MTRIINPDGVGKQRTRLCRAIVLTMRELADRQEADDETRDMVAFIILALRRVTESVEQTVAAWEKRDYWLKADRFRRQWQWARLSADRLTEALNADDWAALAATIPTLSEKLANVRPPRRSRLGEPWHGAYERWAGGTVAEPH